MSESKRLSGLELLRMIGAPVPEWQVVMSANDIIQLKLPKTEYGWTIRTCRFDGLGERGLFYLNYAKNFEISTVLRNRFSAGSRNEFYIVYPSWKFRFSCNVVLEEQVFIIEGAYGSQKDIAIGKSGPEFGMRIPFGFRSKMECFTGSVSDEVIRWIGKILWWCKHIPWEAFYLEVALMHNSTLMFYELIDLRTVSLP